MKRLMVFGVVMLATMSTPALAQQIVRQYWTNIPLTVDQHGQVTHVGSPTKLAAMLVDPVRKVVASWRFKPPRVNGRPVTIMTYAYASVDIIKRPDKRFGLRVHYVNNGPKLSRWPIAYPREAMRLHEQGSYVIRATVEPDGSIDHVAVTRKSPGQRGAHVLTSVVEKEFMKLRAAPMLVDGEPTITHLKLDINFVLGAPDAAHHATDTTKRSGAPKSQNLIATDSPLQRVPGASHPVASIGLGHKKR